jgi:HEPN domain-containing protein
MKPLTQEWIDKAEGDWSTLMREFRARKNPNYDAVCFHAQQCAEKYLKARLQEASIPFKKIHDLKILLNDILPIEQTWISLRNNADSLTIYAVKFRCPGNSSSKLEAKESVKHCRLIRKTVRQSFGLSTAD